MLAVPSRKEGPKLVRLLEKPGLPLLLLILPIFLVPSSLTNIELVWEASSRIQSLAVFAAIFGIVAYGLGMLMRFAGLPSVVHGALWGMGAYAAGLAASNWGLSFWAVIPLAIIVPMSMAVLTGTIALRTAGGAFIIITIALAEFVVLVGNNWTSLTQGAGGLVVAGGPDDLGPFSFGSAVNRYYLSLAFLYITIGIVWYVSQSPFGRRLTAIRDNEALARSLGINTFLYKMMIFTISAGIVGVAGQLFLYHNQAIQPDLFGAFDFIKFLLMVVLGGTRVLAGPAVGAWFVIFVPEWFAPLGLNDPNGQQLMYGILLVAFMLVAPFGLVGTAKIYYFGIKHWVLSLAEKRRTPVATRPEPTATAIAQSVYPDPGVASGPSTAAPLARSASRGDSTARKSMTPNAAQLANPGRHVKAQTPLRVEDVKRDFQAVCALDGVDLNVREGEILGIIGPNGSGKTTLFNCVSGFLGLTAGRVIWNGRDISGWPADRIARHGLVRTFQQQMHFMGTVEESCRIALESWNGIGHQERIRLPIHRSVDDVLDFCGLTGVADMPSTALSYGQARTLGLAVALAAGPRVLMLDEPAAGLNDQEGEALQALLQRIRDAGVTIVVVDHDMRFLMPLCDRVIVLDAGSVICEGVPEQIQSDDRVIAVYLGERFIEQRAKTPDEGSPR